MKYVMKRTGLVFLTIFLLSFAIRLIFVSSGIFHFDSVTLARAVEKTASEGKLQKDHAASYLNVLINTLLFKIFCIFGADIETSLKISVMIYAALSCCMLYVTVSGFARSELAGIASAALLSLSPAYLAVTTIPLNHALALLFVFTSYYFLHKEGIANNMIASGSMLLCLLVRVDYGFFMIPGFLYCITKLREPKGRKAGSIKLAIFTIPAGLLIAARFLFQTYYAYGFFSYNAFSPRLANMLIAIDFSYASLTIPVVALAISVIIYMILLKKYSLFLMFCAWIFVPAFYYSNIAGSKARYFFPSYVPMIILAALAAKELSKMDRRACIGLLASLCAFMMVCAYPVVGFRHNYSSAIEYAKLINMTTEDNSALILYGDDEPLMQFYTTRSYIPYPLGNTDYTFDNLTKKIKADLDENIPVYISETVFLLDSQSRAELRKRELNQDFKLVQAGSFLWENPHVVVTSERFNVTIYRIEKRIG